MDDHARRVVERGVAKREVLRTHLPERRDAAVDHAEPE
jgi:hypothetical protein